MKLPALFTTIGIGLLVLVLALFWYEAYGAYMLNHQYYYSMFEGKNWWIVIWMIISALIPISVIFLSRSFSFKNFSIALALGLLVSSYAHTILKGWVIGWVGKFLLTFNTIFFIALIAVFVVSIYCIGAKVYEYILKQTIKDRYDILFALGFWLAVFVIINYILIAFNIFHPIVTWLELCLALYLVWKSSTERSQAVSIMNQSGQFFFSHSNWIRPFAILLTLSIVYFYFWFNLSFIPYSTAWDANHAYMYLPKVMANNNGMWLDQWAVGWSNLWMVYIAYWFSLMRPLSPWFTLAPDTVAVVMNFLSGLFALVFGLGALSKAIAYFTETNESTDKKAVLSRNLSFWLGWMYFLLWLLSGMGAFLVFVDNKTDLGVMALSMLALMSWFTFLQHVGDPQKHTERAHWYMKDITKYALISGFFFALATMAKATAFQDILIFGLLIIVLRVGVLGAIGWFLFVLWILGRAETMSIVYYVSKSLGTKLLWVGWLGLLWQAFIAFKNNSRRFLKPLSLWALTILLTLLVLKGPFLLVSQAQQNTLSPSNFVKSLLMWYRDSEVDSGESPIKTKHSSVFLAQAGDDNIALSSGYLTPVRYEPTINPAMCSLSAVQKTSQNLFDNLPQVEGWGLVEDLGRYIGFWQRTFSAPSTRNITEKNSYGFVRLWYPLLKLFYHTPGCYGSDLVAKYLCDNKEVLVQSNSTVISELLTTVDSWSRGALVLNQVLTMYTDAAKEDQWKKESTISYAQKLLVDYMQWNIIEVTKDMQWNVSIAIPYSYMTPLNVIFNRSLQNLSSYYTDIGFIWILSLVLLIVWLCTTFVWLLLSLLRKEQDVDYKLFALHLVTVFGWIIWWFIASGIIWYAVGIIAWTIFSNVLFVAKLVRSDTQGRGRAGWSLVSVIILVCTVQTLLNLFRISSQWGEGPFVWYKGNASREVVYELSSQWILPKEKVNNSYRASDVFNLQFGIYNDFINYVRDRKDEDGVMVAGTYIQYFLENQNNIAGDGLLTELRKWWENGNTCLLAQRLKDKKIKYLVIDPNVGSVGGSTLLDRFIAKVDPKTNTVVTDGAATILAKMIRDWYLQLISTNTLGAKYAYSMSDADLTLAIASVPDMATRLTLENAFKTDDLLFRAKLALPRYFGQEANAYYTLIGTIFQRNLSTTNWLYDLANVFGKSVSQEKISSLLNKLMQWNITTQDMISANTEMTDDERFVIWQYLQLVQLQKSGNHEQMQTVLNSILQQSLAGGSQVMTFELKI